MKIVDKIFVINFDNNEENWNECLKQFKKFDIDNYIRIPCLLKDLNDIKKEKYLNFSHKYLMKKGMIKNKNNYILFELGLKLAHLDIIKQAKNNNYKNILILEDNFEFKDNFLLDFDNLLKIADKIYYGLLYLSNLFDMSDGEIYYNKLREVKNNHETLALCLNKRIFNVLINKIENSNYELDRLLNNEIHKIYSCYISNPDIIKKKNSNLNNNLNNKFKRLIVDTKIKN